MAKQKSRRVSDAAKELARHGAAKGGEQRASRLSPEQRSAIARKGAAARWKRTKDESNMPVALCGGKEPLRLGDVEIPCYVLEDGFTTRDEDRRVITVSGFQAAIGMAASGGSPRLASFAMSIAGNSTAGLDLSARLNSPVEFVMPKGGIAKGYSALLLADLCDVILEARKQGRLTLRYKAMAEAAEIVMRGLANVAIVALIDEATGYQYIRRRLALAEILDKYLDDKLNKWTKTFEIEYYMHLFRLKGFHFEHLKSGDEMPSWVGKVTRNVVYRRLAPGIVRELERQNPVDELGRRPHKHHQWLTREIGHPALKEHLAKIVTTMKLSGGWTEFERNLTKVLPLDDDQLFFDEFFGVDDDLDLGS